MIEALLNFDFMRYSLISGILIGLEILSKHPRTTRTRENLRSKRQGIS